jgi:DNA polymerase III subunit delta'
MGFDSFLGNPKAVSAVRDMLAAGRVPHALLFAGPDGVGKKTVAIMLAKALNCERLRADFCGECTPCRKADEMLAATRDDLARRKEIKEGTRRVEGLVYFDLQLIAPLTRHILIEQIRKLRNVAYTRPFELKRRVLIVDQAQAIHWQAIDLLLKVLEEPPDTTTLILVCPNAYEIRSTLRSRCRRVPFTFIDESILRDVLAKEDRVPAAQRGLVARLADGSLARARSLDLADFQTKRRPWLDFLESVTAKGTSPASGLNWKMLFESTKALTEKREQFEDTLRVGYLLCSDLLRLLEGQPESSILNVDVSSRLKAWAPKLGVKGIVALKNGLDEAYRLQTRNVNQQLGLEVLALAVGQATSS